MRLHEELLVVTFFEVDLNFSQRSARSDRILRLKLQVTLIHRSVVCFQMRYWRTCRIPCRRREITSAEVTRHPVTDRWMAHASTRPPRTDLTTIEHRHCHRNRYVKPFSLNYTINRSTRTRLLRAFSYNSGDLHRKPPACSVISELITRYRGDQVRIFTPADRIRFAKRIS